SKAEQGIRHRCERDVGVLLPSHPGVAALAVPEGEHVGINLFGGGHACPPVERLCTLQLCRVGSKRRRTDVISTAIRSIARRPDDETLCPLWVKSGLPEVKRLCPLPPRKRTWLGTVLMSALRQKRTFCVAGRLPGPFSRCEWLAHRVTG